MAGKFTGGKSFTITYVGPQTKRGVVGNVLAKPFQCSGAPIIRWSATFGDIFAIHVDDIVLVVTHAIGTNDFSSSIATRRAMDVLNNDFFIWYRHGRRQPIANLLHMSRYFIYFPHRTVRHFRNL